MLTLKGMTDDPQKYLKFIGCQFLSDKIHLWRKYYQQSPVLLSRVVV